MTRTRSGASGHKDLLEKSRNPDETAADLGYIGVDGIGTVPFRKPQGEKLKDWRREFNAELSEEGGRYRCPIGSTKACWWLLPEFFPSLMNYPPGAATRDRQVSALG
jgi:hypothetical protein